MPSFLNALTLLSVQEPFGWADASRQSVDEGVTPIVIVTVSILGVVALAWIKSRARLQEQRLHLIRELADKGQLTPELLESQLRPKSRWKPAVMVAAWFLLMGGAGMTIAAFAEEWPNRYSEFGAPGVTMIGFALATLSAPIMLRELRRQKVV